MLRPTAFRKTCFCTIFSVVSVAMFSPPPAAYVRSFHTPYIVTYCDNKTTEQRANKTTEQHFKERESCCDWRLIGLGIGPPFRVYGQMVECMSEISCSLLLFLLRRESGSVPSLCQLHIFTFFVNLLIYTVTFSNMYYIHVLYQHRLCAADVYLRFLTLLWQTVEGLTSGKFQSPLLPVSVFAISIQCYEHFHSCYFVWVCEWNIKKIANMVPCTQYSQQCRYRFLQKLVTSCLIRERLDTRNPCSILSNKSAVLFVNQSKKAS